MDTTNNRLYNQFEIRLDTDFTEKLYNQTETDDINRSNYHFPYL